MRTARVFKHAQTGGVCVPFPRQPPCRAICLRAEQRGTHHAALNAGICAQTVFLLFAGALASCSAPLFFDVFRIKQRGKPSPRFFLALMRATVRQKPWNFRLRDMPDSGTHWRRQLGIECLRRRRGRAIVFPVVMSRHSSPHVSICPPITNDTSSHSLTPASFPAIPLLCLTSLRAVDTSPLPSPAADHLALRAPPPPPVTRGLPRTARHGSARRRRRDLPLTHGRAAGRTTHARSST